MEWCLELKGSFSRARRMMIELEMWNKETYLFRLINDSGPRFVLELNIHEMLPLDDRFGYAIKINGDIPFIV